MLTDKGMLGCTINRLTSLIARSSSTDTENLMALLLTLMQAYTEGEL